MEPIITKTRQLQAEQEVSHLCFLFSVFMVWGLRDCLKGFYDIKSNYWASWAMILIYQAAAAAKASAKITKPRFTFYYQSFVSEI